jgi:hypothetical protein
MIGRSRRQEGLCGVPSRLRWYLHFRLLWLSLRDSSIDEIPLRVLWRLTIGSFVDDVPVPIPRIRSNSCRLSSRAGGSLMLFGVMQHQFPTCRRPAGWIMGEPL